jgi:hypothetical protein
MRPLVSEDEFIRIWNKHHSATRVADEIGIAVQNVAQRRRAIEKRTGIRLLAFDSRPSYDQSMLVTADRVEAKLKLKDGVILVAGDQHYHPGNVPVMHRALCHLAKKLKPFAVVWNGDAFDGATVSRHPSIGWEDKPTVQQEIECVNDRSKEIMDAAPSAKRIWCAGNHDLRLETRIATATPEFRGVKGVHLKDHFPEWTPAWFVTVNEGTQSHTEIRHREKGGVHAGYNNTVSSGVSMVTGHDHRADVVPYDDRRGRRYAVRHGMTADSSRDGPFVNYLEGRKTNWQSAFAILTYRDGELLMPELAMRWDSERFQFRGELIKV